MRNDASVVRRSRRSGGISSSRELLGLPGPRQRPLEHVGEPGQRLDSCRRRSRPAAAGARPPVQTNRCRSALGRRHRRPAPLGHTDVRSHPRPTGARWHLYLPYFPLPPLRSAGSSSGVTMSPSSSTAHGSISTNRRSGGGWLAVLVAVVSTLVRRGFLPPVPSAVGRFAVMTSPPLAAMPHDSPGACPGPLPADARSWTAV